jgi:hypothetical protein
MESHRIWIANLQDMLMTHVCQGLLKTYSEILRLCGGHKIKYSIQTAMEGIAHLNSHKINADYRILLESLAKMGYVESNLNDLLLNAYSSYALSALKSAGIPCEKLDPELLTGPKGSSFIHEIYINIARNLWMRPDVLVDNNVPQLKVYFKEAVEQAVRSGVNLNALIAALKAPADSKSTLNTSEDVIKVGKPTIKEKLSMLNGSKTLLDDETSSDDEEDLISIKKETKRPSGDEDSMPSFVDDPGSELMTIDDEELAPDNITITFDGDSYISDALPTNTKYELTLDDSADAGTVAPAPSISQRDKEEDLIIDLTPRTGGAAASVGTELELELELDTEGDLELELDTEDGVDTEMENSLKDDLTSTATDTTSSYTVFTVPQSDRQPFKAPVKEGFKGPVKEGFKAPVKEGFKAPVKEGFKGPVKEGFKGPVKEGFKAPVKEGFKGPVKEGFKAPVKEGFKGPVNDYEIPDYLITGIVDNYEASQYTVTLLSHSDMLSSRLARLGVH